MPIAGRHDLPVRQHDATDGDGSQHSPDHGLRDLVDQCCGQAGFAPRIGHEIDEPAAIFGFVVCTLIE